MKERRENGGKNERKKERKKLRERNSHWSDSFRMQSI
jgi:hypothetical protein